jgi:predicted component of type VI protein secretion system
MCDSEIVCTLPRIAGIRTQINTQSPEKSKLRYQKTYRDFRDWCYSSATTGQLLYITDRLRLITDSSFHHY